MKKIFAIILASIMMLSAFATVFAADEFLSPGAKDFYNVVANVKDDKGGTANSEKPTVPVGDTVKITAKEDDGFTFIGWTFTGEFEWVEGDANSKVIVVRPKSDVVFTAAFEGKGPDKDTDKESPVTGYENSMITAVMATALALGAFAVAYTGKKYLFGAK